MNKIEFSVKLGKALLDREHCHFIDDHLDNSEHIYAIRRIIETIGENLISESIPAAEVFNVFQRLQKHAQDNFVDIWLAMPRVEGESELEAGNDARIAFNQCWEEAEPIK
jgi:hypothetical protein